MEKNTDSQLYVCLTHFFKLQGKVVNFTESDFYRYNNLISFFDELDLSDFETIVEDHIFNGRDVIPDGMLTTLSDYKKFIDKIKAEDNKFSETVTGQE